MIRTIVMSGILFEIMKKKKKKKTSGIRDSHTKRVIHVLPTK